MPTSTGLLQFINRTCSKTVVCLAGLALVYFRTKPVVLIVFGALLNATVGKIAKKLVNQARPSTSLRTSHGMPSSHANSLFFWSTHLTLWLPLLPLSESTRVLIALGLYSYSILVCMTRVYIEGDHTLEQITAGALLGSSTAYAWKEIMNPTPYELPRISIHS